MRGELPVGSNSLTCSGHHKAEHLRLPSLTDHADLLTLPQPPPMGLCCSYCWLHLEVQGLSTLPQMCAFRHLPSTLRWRDSNSKYLVPWLLSPASDPSG